MFLPTVLALTLCCWTQEPKVGPATVAPATAEVPAESISLVRSELGQALRDLSGVFGLKDIRPFVVIVHEGGTELPAELTSLHHEGSPGFTILSRHEIHLMLREVARHNRGLRTVVMHELSHELLDQACGEHGLRIPRWFHEGMAQVLAGDTYLGVSEEMIVWRAATGKLTPFYELESRFPAGGLELSVAYAQSYSYVNWLDRAYGTQTLLSMARAVDEETTLERAMVRWTGKSTEALHEGWRHHLVHGSGAIWRSTLSEFFPISVVLLLPVLVIAMLRRKRAERAASRKLLQQDIDAAARAASAEEHAEAADVAGNRGVPQAQSEATTLLVSDTTFRRALPFLIAIFCWPAVGCMAHKHVVGLGPTGLGEVSQRQYYLFFGLVNLSEVNVQNMAGNLTSYSIETERSFTDLLLMPLLLPVTVTTRTVTVKT